MTDDLKYCTKCGVGKPVTSEHFPIRSDVGGFNAQCRKCKTQIRRKQYLQNREKTLLQSREWKANNKEKRRVVHKKWYAENKERVLQHSRGRYHENIEYERTRSKKYRDTHKDEISAAHIKYRKLNPEKISKQSRNWYIKNKEKHLVSGRLWRRNNKDKARSLLEKYRANKISNGGEYSIRDITRLRHLQRDECFYCGCDIENKYHVEHIIPLSKGGSNFCGNIVLVCPSCNSSKGNKFLMEWKVYKQNKVA